VIVSGRYGIVLVAHPACVWRIHKKLIELLEDLHDIGTKAAVRMEGQKIEWFDVRGGVKVCDTSTAN
jgi:hypothetical protein